MRRGDIPTVKAAINASNDFNFKSSPSKEEQTIIITNHPHAIPIQSGGAKSV